MPATAESLGLAPPSSAESLGLVAPPKERGFFGTVGEGLSALGSDIKSTIIDPTVNFLKTPGDVYLGKYGGPGSPELESAGRNFAVGMTAAGSPLGRAASEGAAAAGGRAAGTVGEQAGRVASDVLPGANRRAAQGALEGVGTPATQSTMGDAIRSGMWEKIGAMNEGQRAQAGRALARHGIDLNDPASLPEAVFNTRDSVRVAKALSSPEIIAQQARSYAATQLDARIGATPTSWIPSRTASRAAQRAEAWEVQNADWLGEAGIKDAVDQYVAYLHRTASTQKTATAIATATSFLGSGHGVESLMYRAERLVP